MIASNIFPAFQVNNIFYQIEEQVEQLVHISYAQATEKQKADACYGLHFKNI
jgi:hypothetical protein